LTKLPWLLFKGIGQFPGVDNQGMTLTTHFHLVPTLRMSGTIPLLPLYAFMVWTGTTLLFTKLQT